MYFGSRSTVGEIVRRDADSRSKTDELVKRRGSERHRVFGAVPARLNPRNRFDGRFAFFVDPPAVLVVGSRQRFSVTEALSNRDRRLEEQLAFPNEAREQILRV